MNMTESAVNMHNGPHYLGRYREACPHVYEDHYGRVDTALDYETGDPGSVPGRSAVHFFYLFLL
jgi:hypothetical protein